MNLSLALIFGINLHSKMEIRVDIAIPTRVATIALSRTGIPLLLLDELVAIMS